MPDNEPSTPPRLLTATIVGSYLRKNQLPADQLGSLISTVHQTLAAVGKPPPEEPAEPLKPAVPIKQSFTKDQVICLDCGWKGKMLRRHLTVRHALTRDKYRARWQLSQDHPLTAPAYSENRSAFAKKIGLGQAAKASRGRTRRSPRENAVQAQE